MTWWSRRRRRPEPPENVRINLRDGRVIPAECVYIGYQDQAHTWHVVNADITILEVDSLAIAVLPAYTRVLFPVTRTDP